MELDTESQTSQEETYATIKQGVIFHYVPNSKFNNFGRWREQLFVLNENGLLTWYKDPRRHEQGIQEGSVSIPSVSRFVAVGSYTRRAPPGPPVFGSEERLIAIASRPSKAAPVLWLFFTFRSELLEWLKAFYISIQPYSQRMINVNLMKPVSHKNGTGSPTPSNHSSTEDLTQTYTHPFNATHLRRLMETGLGLGLGWGLPHQSHFQITPMPVAALKAVFGGYEKARKGPTRKP